MARAGKNLVLSAALVAVAAGGRAPLPTAYERVEGLELTDGRRRLESGLLDAAGGAEELHLAFSTQRRRYEIDLHHVQLWAGAALLVVNEKGRSNTPPLPRLFAFQGRLHNASGLLGGGVSAVVLADGTMRVHIYEDGEDIVLESARHFDGRSGGTSAPSAPLDDDYIVYRSSDLTSGGATDEVLHHSPVPLRGLHANDGRRRQLSSEGGGFLPTGPPYGRLTNCPASPSFYTNNIGIVVDEGFASVVGGTTAAVTAEVASIISQTNLIYADQVGVVFAIGTLIINLDDSASFADGGVK